MTSNARGIDISSFQGIYTAAELAAYDFAFFRASVGTTDTDPHFAENWANAKAAKIHRFAYHELTDLSPVSTQAGHFIGTVKAQGVLAGDGFAVVASDYPGVTGAAVRDFAGAVRAAFPHGPVLVYSDQAGLPDLAECTGYPLWLAHYAASPGGAAPWSGWKFWQFNGTGTDSDIYNGTAAELQAWLDTFAPAPPEPPADRTYGPPQHLTVTAGRTSARFEWSAPAGAAPPPESYLVSVYDSAGKLAASYPRTVAGSPYQGGSLTEGASYTVHVAVQEPASRVKAGVHASASFRTG